MWALIKKTVYVVYVLFLMAFAVWYGTFMYPLIFGFAGKEEAALSLQRLAGEPTDEQKILEQLVHKGRQTVANDLGYRVITQPYIEGRFHHIGFRIQQDKAGICIRCHGSVPHDQSREVRSFLNMHVFYMACETCHVLSENPNEPWDFRWYDKNTGEPTANPTKLVEIENSYLRPEDFERKYLTYGDYGAKIAPGRAENGEFDFLIGTDMLAVVEKYLRERSTLAPEQESQVKRVIHRRVAQKAVECHECHDAETQYIPLAELGYPPRRVDELTTTAAVGMIGKYEEFWIPSMLSPGLGGKVE